MSHPIELSEVARAAYDRMVVAREQVAYFREIEDAARAVIEAELGEGHDAGTVDGVEVVTRKPVKSTRLDTATVKRELPDVYALYSKTAESRRFVVVTAKDHR